jgi:hypothetical protein
VDGNPKQALWCVLGMALLFFCLAGFSLIGGAVGMYRVSNNYFIARSLYFDELTVPYQTVTNVSDTVSYYNYYSIDMEKTLSSISNYATEDYYVHLCFSTISGDPSDLYGYAQPFFPPYWGSQQIAPCGQGGVQGASGVAICDGAPPLYMLIQNLGNDEMSYTLQIYVDQNCTGTSCDCNYTWIYVVIIMSMIGIGLGALCSCGILTSIGCCICALFLFLRKKITPTNETGPLINSA